MGRAETTPGRLLTIAALVCFGASFWSHRALGQKPAAAHAAKPAPDPTEGKIIAHPLPKDGVPPPLEAPSTPRRTLLGAEDLRLGAFQAPPKAFPFPLLGDDRAREVYVDKEGELYKQRKYSGLVPDWRQKTRSYRGGRCKVQAQPLSWVGFQNHAASSRIFVQVETEACGYVYRPDDRHIVIDLPGVTIPNANLKREILTGAFPTPVELVHVEEVVGRGTRVIVVLKESRRYLSAHVGRFVFVDVAR